MNSPVLPAAEAAPERTAQVLHVLEDYLARLERGAAPRPEELIAAHPDLAGPLREYLASLDFLHRAALSLRSGGPAVASPAAADLGPDQFGDFRIVRQVGRGGMGIVYEAEQVSLNRRVALKVLPFAMTLDPRQLQRFQNEAQAAACLHHSNIVPVYAVGSERGVHFYAMQFIDGRTLADLVAELRRPPGVPAAARSELADGLTSGRWAPKGSSAVPELPTGSPAEPASDTAVQPAAEQVTRPAPRGKGYFRTVAGLGVQAAEALEHAHQTGVVHRDIKPANLMLDGRGHLWITDFGLAQFQADAGLTLTGDLLGTLRYMSPEQARGGRGGVDHRTDVYSLGVTLYELLALRPAFGGNDRQEVLSRIALEEPPPPRRLDPGIPRDLETVVLKAMAKGADERYPTAQELADDLRRFLNDRPLRARRPTLGQRLVKWLRRHRALVVTATVTALLGLALAVVVLAASFVQVNQALEQRTDALTKFREEEAIRQTVNTFMLDDLLGQADLMVQGQPDWQPDRNVKVRTLLDRAATTVERRFQDRPLVEAAIRLTLGNAYGSLGEYTKAQPHLERALAIRRGTLGNEHPDTLTAMNSLAWLYIANVQTLHQPDTEALVLEALEVSRRVLGEEHPLTITATGNLARLRLGTGKLDEAEPLLVQTLEAYHRVLGPEHRDTLRTQLNLAVLHDRRSRYAKAEALYLETLEDCRRALGTEHPLTLLCMNNLAGARKTLRQYASAEPLIVQALDVSRRVLGTEHDTTHLLLNNLAELYLEQRQYAKAEPPIIESLNIYRALPKEERRRPIHRATTHAMELLEARPRLDLLDQKKYAEAEPALRCLVEGVHYGNPWLNSVTRSLLGACLAGQQKYAEAEPLLLAAFQGFKDVEATIPMPQRACLADTAERAVQLYEAWGKPEQAAEWRKRLDEEKQKQPRWPGALAHFQRGLTLAKEGKDAEAEAAFREAVGLEPKYAEAHYRLGVALANQGKYPAAEAALQEVVRLPKDFYAASVLPRQASFILGWVLERQDKAAEAESAYHAAFPFLPPDSPNFASNYFGIGTLLYKEGNNALAEAAFRKAIHLKPDYAEAHYNLGMALSRQRKYAQAEAAYREAVRLKLDYAEAHYFVGHALGDQGKWVEAEAAIREAIRLKPNYHEAHFGLGVALSMQGKYTEAAAAYREVIRLKADDAGAHTELGNVLDRQKKWQEAIAAFEEAIRHRPNDLGANYKLAQILTLCPQKELRNPGRAVEVARKLVELPLEPALAWQLLGWAEYQAGNWNASIEALEKSCKLQKGGTGDEGQWIVLALAHGQLANHQDLSEEERARHQAEARRWYDQAVKQIDGNRGLQDDVGQAIREFRAEAAKLLDGKE